jgi:hypothetical protein
MPIRIACTCGQNLAAPDNLAGKKAKCPKCGQLIAVPAPAAKSPPTAPASGGPASFHELLDEAGMTASKTGVRCASCGADMARGAVLCVQCGYHAQLGRRVETVAEDESETKKEDEFAGQYASHGVAALDQAERELLRLKAQDKLLSAGAPWWSLFLALAAFVYLLVRMIMTTPDQAVMETGFVIIAFGGLVFLCHYVILVIIGFREETRYGLLCLLPPYAVYYAITRWAKCKSPAKRLLGGGLTVGFGWLLLILAPNMAPSEEEKNKAGGPPAAASLPWAAPREPQA